MVWMGHSARPTAESILVGILRMKLLLNRAMKIFKTPSLVIKLALLAFRKTGMYPDWETPCGILLRRPMTFRKLT